jgi:transcriptional regulator with XRE-family HTH domain
LTAGDRLRVIRYKLGITTREVEDLSRGIAQTKENEDFFISRGWITRIENNDKTPTICKLYSLCAIYRMKFTELLSLYDVDLAELSKFGVETSLSQTHPADLTVYDAERTVNFPVRFDPGFNLTRSSLLTRMVESWAEVPLALLQHLNLRQHLYGYVGLDDNSMTPLVRPGSFLQIDDSETRISHEPWKNEYERPIYFFELRDGYACSWCELQGDNLFLIPHPLSGYPTRQLEYPKEVEVVGRITALAMRLKISTGTKSEQPGV